MAERMASTILKVIHWDLNSAPMWAVMLAKWILMEFHWVGC